ncbi:hypothetical protein JOF56_010026 [Kibdelosporangium banguiense]|uniref:Uncharacterized protein n=1 Tax=Kibdelosporangium banguiense TaxID=1365924 RepID=A0ABS4TZ02_9PSEU|nr:hypothetical protein [Kibdelosporangium banguiense]
MQEKNGDTSDCSCGTAPVEVDWMVILLAVGDRFCGPGKR